MESNSVHITLQFFKFKKLEFGKALYVVGGIPQLGNWNPLRAARLTWTEGDNWVGILNLPSACDFEYKYFVSWYDSPHPDLILWEPGPNKKKSVSPRNKEILNEPSEISVMSFNLRYANPGDGSNSWEYRKDIVANIIKLCHCDFVGIQEGLVNMIRDLENLLPMYSGYGRWRSKIEEEDEAVIIFYQTDKWFIEKAGTFWLSDNPNEPGSTTFGNIIPRIATWVKFRNIHTLKPVFVYNSHFDHESVASQRKSADMIAKHIAENCEGCQNIVLMGDLNVADNDDSIKILKNNGVRLKDTCSDETCKLKLRGTFHGWSGQKAGLRIDYIFAHPMMKPLDFIIINDNFKGRYPSDHFPIMAKLTLADNDYDGKDEQQQQQLI